MCVCVCVYVCAYACVCVSVSKHVVLQSRSMSQRSPHTSRRPPRSSLQGFGESSDFTTRCKQGPSHENPSTCYCSTDMKEKKGLKRSLQHQTHEHTCASRCTHHVLATHTNGEYSEEYTRISPQYRYKHSTCVNIHMHSSAEGATTKTLLMVAAIKKNFTAHYNITHFNTF